MGLLFKGNLVVLLLTANMAKSARGMGDLRVITSTEGTIIDPLLMAQLQNLSVPVLIRGGASDMWAVSSPSSRLGPLSSLSSSQITNVDSASDPNATFSATATTTTAATTATAATASLSSGQVSTKHGHGLLSALLTAGENLEIKRTGQKHEEEKEEEGERQKTVMQGLDADLLNLSSSLGSHVLFGAYNPGSVSSNNMWESECVRLSPAEAFVATTTKAATEDVVEAATTAPGVAPTLKRGDQYVQSCMAEEAARAMGPHPSLWEIVGAMCDYSKIHERTRNEDDTATSTSTRTSAEVETSETTPAKTTKATAKKRKKKKKKKIVLPWCSLNYVPVSKVFEHSSADGSASKWIDWDALGAGPSTHANFWMGTKGSHTACHQDTYGRNTVVQAHGTKRWILYPPECADDLYPTRTPYEESTVYSRVYMVDCSGSGSGGAGDSAPKGEVKKRGSADGAGGSCCSSPDADISPSEFYMRQGSGGQYESSGTLSSSSVPSSTDISGSKVKGCVAWRYPRAHARRIVVELDAGDVLLVPPRWWHHVEVISPLSISFNCWRPVEGDASALKSEALIQSLFCTLLGPMSGSYDNATANVINPGEAQHLPTREVLIERLRETLGQAACDTVGLCSLDAVQQCGDGRDDLLELAVRRFLFDTFSKSAVVEAAIKELTRDTTALSGQTGEEKAFT